MKVLPKVNPMDYKFMKVEPDPDFDPERNRRTIDSIIKWNDALARKNDKEHTEEVRERSEALAMYLNRIDNGGGNPDLAKYFGKRELGRLRGEEVLARISDPLIVRNSEGKIIRRAGDVEAHT